MHRQGHEEVYSLRTLHGELRQGAGNPGDGEGNRGFHTEIVPPYGKDLVDTSCVGCGQRVQVCPVGALSIRDNTDEVYHQMAAGKTMVIQMAPSVRIILAEALGQEALAPFPPERSCMP
ncbi:MAG: hypothetical protein ACLUD2_06105 [Clostridium sp.]